MGWGGNTPTTCLHANKKCKITLVTSDVSNADKLWWFVWGAGEEKEEKEVEEADSWSIL